MLSKKVFIYRMGSNVILKIGRWPFRQTVIWNTHSGPEMSNMDTFIRGLQTARTKGVKTTQKTNRLQFNKARKRK